MLPMFVLGTFRRQCLKCLTVVRSQITAFRTSSFIFIFLLSYLFILRDQNTQKVKENDIYFDKTQHAIFRGNPFFKLQNNT